MDELLKRLEEHIDALLSENDRLRAEVKMLRQATLGQKDELVRSHQLLTQLKQQYDAVRTAYDLSADTEKKTQAKQQLTHLMQLVDKAIKAVNEAEYRDETKHNYLYQ